MKGRKITPAEICKVFDCTPYQLKEQYKRDTAMLKELKEQAKKDGRPIRGYTIIAHLNARVNTFKSLVNKIQG